MSDQAQKSELVRQHKRMAMGVPLTGQDMGQKVQQNNNQQKGGLAQAKKK